MKNYHVQDGCWNCEHCREHWDCGFVCRLVESAAIRAKTLKEKKKLPIDAYVCSQGICDHFKKARAEK